MAFPPLILDPSWTPKLVSNMSFPFLSVASTLLGRPLLESACDAAALRLLEQLDAGDRLALLPERSIPVGRECGLFSVPKSALKDRMVLDARPANCFADPPEGLIQSLGSPLQLQYLFVPEGSVLEGYAEDLQEFYHSFVIGPERIARNALKLRVKPWEVKHLKAYAPYMSHEESLVLCLRALAMGDSRLELPQQAA